MNENETLREQMWDLCYGLLSAEEVTALHKLIKSDPAAARLYAEVRLQADLVASAAKVEDESVSLSVPDEGRKVQPAAKSLSGAGESPFKPAKSSRSGKKSLSAPTYRTANWLAALAATALLALVGYGLYAPTQFGASAPPDSIVASVYSRQPLQSGLTHNFKVVATNGHGEPAEAAVMCSVIVNGSVVEQDVVQTDKSGEAQLSLSGSSMQPGAVLEVQAQGEKQNEFFQRNEQHLSEWAEASPKFMVPLHAKPEPVVSDVHLEKDSYQPGETFRFWSHSRRAFSNQPALEADEWKLVAADGREIQPAAIETRPEAGIVSGEFQIPSDGPQGYYNLVAVNHKAGTSEDLEHVPVGIEAERAANLARRFAGADRKYRMLMQSESLAEMSTEKAEEKQARKLSMAQNGTELAAAAPGGGGGAPPAPGAVPPLPAPATAPVGPAAAKAPAPPRGVSMAAAPSREKESPKPGLAGNLRNATSSEEKGDRKGGQQGDEQQPHASFEEKKEERVAQLSGDALVVEVPAELSHLNLRAVVTKWNVPVATQEYHGRSLSVNNLKQIKELDSSPTNSPAPIPAAEPVEALAKIAKDAEGDDRLDTSRKLSVPLPPEADGELGVTLYDQTAVPPKPVYRQLVRRASARDLNIGIEPERTDLSPQQEVRLKLTVTDQNGVAVPHSYFAARIVKADAVAEVAAAEGAPAPASRFAADKMEGAVGGRGRATAGAGFGGGKGIAAKDADAKEEKQDAPQPKEDVKREGKESESKLKKAQDGSAKPAELAANAAPAPPAAAPAGSGGIEKFSSSSEELSRDFGKQLAMEDRTARGEPAPVTTYSEGLSEDAPVVPQEVLLGSNDSLIQDAVRAEEVAAQVAQANFQRTVGRVVLVVAAAALLLFGLLAILHRPAQAKVWVPAMLVVAASFGIGCFWLMNGNIAPRQVAGTAALTPESAAPVKRYVEEPKPMAPANGSLLLPAMDDRSGIEMDKVNEGSIRGVGPTVLLPSAPADGVESKSAQLGFPSGGGSGLAGGKPVAARTAPPKPEPADDKPSEPEVSANRRADDVKKADDLKKKMADSRQNTDPGKAEAAKDAVRPKKSGSAAPAEMPAMKSAKTEPQLEKRDKAATKLLWAPNLPANDKGEAELNIQLPAEPGDYYLLVDVQGPTGIGTVQSLIRVPSPAPAAPAPAAKPEPPKP